MQNNNMKVRILTYRLPGWLAPLMVLLALAMIPVAIALALGILAIAMGVGVVRALLPPPRETPPGTGEEVVRGTENVPERNRRSKPSALVTGADDQPVIDVEYEVKDGNEKG
jgi:hypothetical protein